MSFANHLHSLANSSQRLIRNFLFEIWWPKFASEFSGRVRVRIRIRIRSRIAATTEHSGTLEWAGLGAQEGTPCIWEK